MNSLAPTTGNVCYLATGSNKKVEEQGYRGVVHTLMSELNQNNDPIGDAAVLVAGAARRRVSSDATSTDSGGSVTGSEDTGSLHAGDATSSCADDDVGLGGNPQKYELRLQYTLSCQQFIIKHNLGLRTFPGNPDPLNNEVYIKLNEIQNAIIESLFISLEASYQSGEENGKDVTWNFCSKHKKSLEDKFEKINPTLLASVTLAGNKEINQEAAGLYLMIMIFLFFHDDTEADKNEANVKRLCDINTKYLKILKSFEDKSCEEKLVFGARSDEFQNQKAPMEDFLIKCLEEIKKNNGSELCHRACLAIESYLLNVEKEYTKEGLEFRESDLSRIDDKTKTTMIDKLVISGLIQKTEKIENDVYKCLVSSEEIAKYIEKKFSLDEKESFKRAIYYSFRTQCGGVVPCFEMVDMAGSVNVSQKVRNNEFYIKASRCANLYIDLFNDLKSYPKELKECLESNVILLALAYNEANAFDIATIMSKLQEGVYVCQYECLRNRKLFAEYSIQCLKELAQTSEAMDILGKFDPQQSLKTLFGSEAIITESSSNEDFSAALRSLTNREAWADNHPIWEEVSKRHEHQMSQELLNDAIRGFSTAR